MGPRKSGRKRLGKKKRGHNVMLRFNDMEYDRLKAICESYDLDISQRGTTGPLLRRLVLDKGAEEKDRLPNASNLEYHINKIGNNINQLVKLAHRKSKRYPDRAITFEIESANALLDQLLKLFTQKRTE